MNTSLPVALLIGASSGLGRALALALAPKYRLVLLASSTARLEETDDLLRATHNVSATLVPMNLEKHDDIDAMIAGIWQRFGRLDILCGLAATTAESSPIAHLEPKLMHRMMMVNALAHYRIIRSCDAILRNTPNAQAAFIAGGMRADGETPNAFTAGFDASKAALTQLVQSYALELEQTSTKAFTIDPACFESRLRRKVFPGQPKGTLHTATEKAAIIAQMFIDNCCINGAHYDV